MLLSLLALLHLPRETFLPRVVAFLLQSYLAKLNATKEIKYSNESYDRQRNRTVHFINACKWKRHRAKFAILILHAYRICELSLYVANRIAFSFRLSNALFIFCDSIILHLIETFVLLDKG